MDFLSRRNFCKNLNFVAIYRKKKIRMLLCIWTHYVERCKSLVPGIRQTGKYNIKGPLKPPNMIVL